MIQEVISLLIDKIKTRFYELNSCTYYKGEFEDGSEWNPVFPAVFLNASGIQPLTETTNEWIFAKIILNVFVAVKLEVDDQQIFLDSFLKYLNSLYSDLELTAEYKFKINTITLKGYFYGIEVYQIEFEVEKVFL